MNVTLTFDADNTRRVFLITLLDDEVDEVDDILSSLLGLDSQDSTVTLSPNETTITIIDNDGKSVRRGKLLDIECPIP